MANSNMQLLSKALNMESNEIKIAQATILAMNMPKDGRTSEKLEKVLGTEFKDAISDFSLIEKMTEYILDRLYIIQRTHGILEPNLQISSFSKLPEKYATLGNIICDCVLLSTKVIGKDLKDENFSYMVFDEIHNPLIIENSRRINQKMAKETLKMNLNPDDFAQLDEKKYIETRAKREELKRLSVDECIGIIESEELSPALIRPMKQSSQMANAIAIMNAYGKSNGIIESVAR